jgi:probable F420-dependent oxidoreductase
MDFGFILPNNWGVEDPKDVVEIAVKAEALGFNSVWVNHHILHVGYVSDRLGDRPYHDALTILTFVAAETSEVRLGTSILVLPYLHPIALAKTLATLDVLSDGRLSVGVGVGPLKEEFDNLGVDFKQRGAYTNESIAIMKELWTNDNPSFNGRFFSFSDVRFYPKPLQKPHPPILIGGPSDSALRRVARLGDGWHPTGMSYEAMSERLDYLEHQLEASNRSIADIDLSVRLEFDILDSPASSSHSPLVGAKYQIIDAIDAYSSMGVREIVLTMSTNDTDRMSDAMERFASEIMPQFD